MTNDWLHPVTRLLAVKLIYYSYLTLFHLLVEEFKYL